MALRSSPRGPREPFRDAAPPSQEQRARALNDRQRRALQALDRDHQERVARLKSEQEQQREAAIRDALRRRLAQTAVRHHAPAHAPPRYRDRAEEAERQARQEVAAREARDLTWLERQHERRRGRMLATFERRNERGPGTLEQARDNARTITKARSRSRDAGRER